MSNKVVELLDVISKSVSGTELQVSVFVSDGESSGSLSVNHESGFMISHPILQSMAEAKKESWGSICQLAHSIGQFPGTRFPSDENLAVGDRIPDRCKQLKCERCKI